MHWPFEHYAQMYAAAAEGIKAVDPSLRVGGPASAWPTWVKSLIQYCENGSIPLDFVRPYPLKQLPFVGSCPYILSAYIPTQMYAEVPTKGIGS
jgi:hypothetical protein